MKQIKVNIGYHIQTILFMNDAKAQLAYDKIKAALEDFEMFKPNRAKVVSFEDDDRGDATLRLDELRSVIIEDCDEKQDYVFVAVAEREKRIRDLTAHLKPNGAESGVRKED